MISKNDKMTIVDIAREYNVAEILLFGSSADPNKKSNDIDLAVKGVLPEEFFRFYGDLLFGLSKPVDLVDLTKDTKFNRLICREGVRLYGENT